MWSMMIVYRNCFNQATWIACYVKYSVLSNIVVSAHWHMGWLTYISVLLSECLHFRFCLAFYVFFCCCFEVHLILEVLVGNLQWSVATLVFYAMCTQLLAIIIWARVLIELKKSKLMLMLFHLLLQFSLFSDFGLFSSVTNVSAVLYCCFR